MKKKRKKEERTDLLNDNNVWCVILTAHRRHMYLIYTHTHTHSLRKYGLCVIV